MGGMCSCGDDEFKPRILMLGMKGAGKTTILHYLKDDEQIKIFSVQDFNTQTIEWEDYEICVWDLGFGESKRNLWRHYFTGSVFVIFVVDASDRSMFKTCKTEFHKIAHVAELKDCPICVLANKSNEPDAATVNEIERDLDVGGMKHLTYQLFPTCATKGEGIDEAMNWVKKILEQNEKMQKKKEKQALKP